MSFSQNSPCRIPLLSGHDDGPHDDANRGYGKSRRCKYAYDESFHGTTAVYAHGSATTTAAGPSTAAGYPANTQCPAIATAAGAICCGAGSRNNNHCWRKQHGHAPTTDGRGFDAAAIHDAQSHDDSRLPTTNDDASHAHAQSATTSCYGSTAEPGIGFQLFWVRCRKCYRIREGKGTRFWCQRWWQQLGPLRLRTFLHVYSMNRSHNHKLISNIKNKPTQAYSS